MRKHKFKAFDKATGRVYPGPYFALFGETTCFDLISQWVMEQPLGKLSLERMNDVEVFQSTGLFDKNGREVFEGDILRYGASKKSGVICDVCIPDSVITWDEKLAGFNLDKDSIADMYEVVGTSYKNPELLK